MINNFLKRWRVILLFLPTVCVATEYQYEEDPVGDGLIPVLSNFRQALVLSKDLDRPLMVQFSTAWCDYCATMEEHVLSPMLKDETYAKKVIIFKLEVDDAWLIGADGKQQSTMSFAMDHDVDLYPTLVFFNSEGKEISKRIVGIRTFNYIGKSIDQSIESALQQ